MTSQPAGMPEPDKMRASDADRERVFAVLSDAMSQGRLTPDEFSERIDIVHQAKTLGELAPVTRDLPVAAMPAVAVPPPGKVGGRPAGKIAFAMMGGAERKGPWVIPRNYTAVAVMGGVDLDLTEAAFEERIVTITAVAIMGGVDIVVPDDVEVQCNGVGIMGGFGHRTQQPATESNRILRVNGVAIMGGVDIRRPRDKGRQELR